MARNNHSLSQKLILFFGLALLAGLISSCDILKSATEFTVDTDWKTVSIDTATLGISIPSGSTIPTISCTDNTTCAAGASQMTCSGQTYECQVTCGASKTCQIGASYTGTETIDLSKKVSANTSAALDKVSFDHLVYNTVDNTLNFDTPQIELYIGPQAATKISDSGVVRLATIAPITKGEKKNENIIPTAEGQATLTAFAKDYKTPFKLLMRAGLSFAGGAPIPSGKLTLQFKAYFLMTPAE